MAPGVLQRAADRWESPAPRLSPPHPARRSVMDKYLQSHDWDRAFTLNCQLHHLHSLAHGVIMKYFMAERETWAADGRASGGVKGVREGTEHRAVTWFSNLWQLLPRVLVLASFSMILGTFFWNRSNSTPDIFRQEASFFFFLQWQHVNGAKVSMSLLLARPATSGELNQSAPENGQLASFQLVDVAAERATEAAKGFFFLFFFFKTRDYSSLACFISWSVLKETNSTLTDNNLFPTLYNYHHYCHFSKQWLSFLSHSHACCI